MNRPKCTCETFGNGVISGNDGRLVPPEGCPRHGPDPEATRAERRAALGRDPRFLEDLRAVKAFYENLGVLTTDDEDVLE